jgi:hypothetical protein
VPNDAAEEYINTLFGDSEPEDAWDPGDTVEELIQNLSRRVDLLGQLRTVPEVSTLAEILDDIRLLFGRAVQDAHDEHFYRIVLLREDIEFVLGRLEGNNLVPEDG